jgi:tight adherence protein B
MIARIRARARLRRLTPRQERTLDRALERTRYGRALAIRLDAADDRRSPAAFVRFTIGSALAAAALTMLWIGTPAAVAGTVAGAIGPEILLRRRIAQRSARIAEQLPDVLAGLAAPIRAGASLPQAFAAATDEAEPPLRGVLERTCKDLDAGVPQDESIGRFASRCGVPEARLAARALRVGRQAGAELARVLDEVAETLRDRDRLAREMRAATAQARVSAIVVAALPVVFLLLLSAGARDQTTLLFGEPIGWLLLGVGGLLEGIGILWIRRLTRPKGAS